MQCPDGLSNRSIESADDMSRSWGRCKQGTEMDTKIRLDAYNTLPR